MPLQASYRHWRLTLDTDRILWLTLDRQDASVNSLNRDVFFELEAILTAVSQDLPAGLVIQSGKSKGFIAGADIKQFIEIKNSDEAFDLIRQAQIILDRLNELPIPTLALIRGFCLGGGLELALACQYRIAEDSPATQLGLPEVKLGLHPGWGGTVRLPHLIGAPQAMKMMLTGQSISAKQAARLGVVDAVVPERHLKTAAKFYILNQPRSYHPGFLAYLSNVSWARPWLGRLFFKKLTQKVQEKHYPAPFAIIHNWLRFGAKGPRAMTNEARSIAELMVGPTSRELVRVFLLQDQLKAFAKKVRSNINHVHVVGAGAMGGDIAALCAYKGFKVTLQDQTSEKIAPAMARAHQFFIKKNEQSRAAQAAFDRLIPDPYGHGISQADLIIEAVFEDLAVKQEIFKQLEASAKPEALLASNTSSINLAEIATILKNPERFIGLHFFNPVAKMRLVEIAGVETSHEDSLKKAAAFVNQLGHFPLVVASCPGFLINRILTPYLMEAMILFEEGVPISAIDQAAKDFGMPMGPIELADRIGLDICLSVAEHLAPFYHFQVPEKLVRKVEEKHLGVKTGKGFYRYGPNGQLNVHKTVSFPAPDLSERLILRLCNEAVACWAEKMVENSDLLDAGMIYGAGFAPFRGGPIEYIRQTGANYLLERLLLLQERYGERFKPHADWSKLYALS